MAIYHEDIAEIELSSGSIHRSFLNHSIGSGDISANRFGVMVFRDGQPEELSGSCTGYFVRNTTGETIVINGGVVSGNVAYVTLPAACYAVEGSFSLAIKVAAGGETVTLRIVDGTVDRTNTETIIDPGTIIPSIEYLIAAIAEAEESIPLDYSALNSAVNGITGNKDIAFVLNWVQGSISGTGEETTTDIRIKTENYINIESFAEISAELTAGYIYAICWYSAIGQAGYIGETGWQTQSGTFTFPSGCKLFRVILAKSGNVQIVPSEGVNVSVNGTSKLQTAFDELENKCISFAGYVTGDNYATLLPDANGAKDNSFYLLRFLPSDAGITENLPFDSIQAGYTDLCKLETVSTTSYKMQFLYDRVGTVYTRIYGGGTYGPWYSKTKGYTIHVGAGYQFTKLTDAMYFAFNNENTTVIVHPGTYDIITEMGEQYWQNFSGYNDLHHAMIGNGAHFIFSPDSRVVCQYTGSNSNVNTLYSPFNSLDGNEGDFTIEGMLLVVSGCRYAIHDDVGASTVEQTHRYINCDITNDIRCIGAGLGADMTVEMRDCVFRSSRETPGNSPVSWHNSGGGTTGKCSIVMTGCYVDGAGDNAVQFLAYGESQKKTRVLVSNNSFNAEPICRKYDDTVPYLNFEMLAWNNEIRA